MKKNYLSGLRAGPFLFEINRRARAILQAGRHADLLHDVQLRCQEPQA